MNASSWFTKASSSSPSLAKAEKLLVFELFCRSSFIMAFRSLLDTNSAFEYSRFRVKSSKILGCFVSETKKEEILSAALETIKRYGWKKTTLEDIASQSGMASTSLYYYFRNKNELLHTLAETEHQRILAELRQAISAKDEPKEQLKAYWRALAEVLQREFGRLSAPEVANFREVFWQMAGETPSFDEENVKLLREIIQRGVDEGAFRAPDPELTAQTLEGAMRGVLLNIWKQKDLQTTLDAHQELLRLLLDGALQ